MRFLSNAPARLDTAFVLELLALLAVGCTRPMANADSAHSKAADSALEEHSPSAERDFGDTLAGFFQEFWADDVAGLSNSRGGRLRVNDPHVSLHPKWGRRWEGTSNGLLMIDANVDLFESRAAGLYVELWGGHPGTANKRVFVNGKTRIDLPRSGTEEHDCTYTYPCVSVPLSALVRGKNAFQFTCDRGDSFWGHYMIDNACLRVDLKPSHPAIKDAELQGFSASVSLGDGPSTLLQDRQVLGIDVSDGFENRIEAADFFARYAAFDDTGSCREYAWHGFTLHRKPVNHVGTADQFPFQVTWDTRMIPDQERPLAVRAVLHLKGGLLYRTEVLDNLGLRANRLHVKFYGCENRPRPFWSRANREKSATISLPEDLSNVAAAELWVKTWDGGAGKEKEPFRINGHAYDIISGKAIHNVVFTRTAVDVSHLKPGANGLTLISETHHHGIEILAPGPVLILQFK